MVPERATAEQLRAIAELLTEFCWYADHDLGGQMATLFTDDAWIETPHFKVRGKAEIESHFVARSGTKLSRHTWSNLRVERANDNRFLAVTNMINFVGMQPAPQREGRLAVATSADEIVIEGDVARFVSRNLTVLFELTLPDAVAVA